MAGEFYLARRYFWDRHHGSWGWLISLVPTLSVAVGVAALIITLAIMTGFREDIQQKMLGVHPHIYLSSMLGQIQPNSEFLINKLDNNKQVGAWSPFISGEILIGRGKQTSGASMKGVDPVGEPRVAPIRDKVTQGQWSDLEGLGESYLTQQPKIILGLELARKIGARIGDVVWTITPGSLSINSFSLPKAYQFEVVGLLETGLYDYDSVIAYVDIPSAQALFGLNDTVTGIGIHLKQPQDFEGAAKQIQTDLEGRYFARSWLGLNRNLFSALKLEKMVMSIVQTLVTFVAGFMIASILFLITNQKNRDIGILRAMGATPKTIRKIFLTQGAMMGLGGCLLGILLGVGGALFIGESNLIRLPADVYYIDRVPIKLEMLDVFSVSFFAAIVTLFAAFYPAHRASKVDPIEAIRAG